MFFFFFFFCLCYFFFVLFIYTILTMNIEKGNCHYEPQPKETDSYVWPETIQCGIPILPKQVHLLQQFINYVGIFYRYGFETQHEQGEIRLSIREMDACYADHPLLRQLPTFILGSSSS